jgi:tetratricopeptide (TPR) repeat protein
MGSLNIDVVLQRARHAYAANKLAQARHFADQVLARRKDHVGALALLGRIALAEDKLGEATSHLLRAIELHPNEAPLHLVLGEIRTFQGRFDEAVAEFDAVLRSNPGDPGATARKADAYERWGRRDKARALLEPAVAAGNEGVQQAIVQTRLDLHEKNYEAVVRRARRHLEAGEAKGFARWHLEHNLGRALEHLRRFDEAFAAYQRGNEAVPAAFDPDAWAQAVDELIESFSPQRFAAVPRAAHGSQLPVFVLGMPRSGSTLIEAIISAHPEAAAGGELPHVQLLINSISLDIGSSLPYPACIEDLEQADVDTIAGRYLDRLRECDARASRIVDKYLTNFKHVGMLAVLFPRARIIHCRRQPLDTCLSCFRTPLAPATHPYAQDLAHLGAAYVGYERLMNHWRDGLGIPMLEVRYGDLVSDPRHHIRRIIDFCGLDWDDRCLRFYEADRAVLTASYDQVNRPIYTSAKGRHRDFDRHLGPLKAALAEGGSTEVGA